MALGGEEGSNRNPRKRYFWKLRPGRKAGTHCRAARPSACAHSLSSTLPANCSGIPKSRLGYKDLTRSLPLAGSPTPCCSRAVWSLPVPRKGPQGQRMGTRKHRWAPSGACSALSADFGTISSSPEQSLTLPETAPLCWGPDHSWGGDRRAGPW